jgi:hypothetical protein
MTQFLINLFLPGWRTMKLFREERLETTWEEPGTPASGPLVKQTFICEVEYSKNRDEYRITFSGQVPEHPKTTQAYQKAVEYINIKNS